MTTPTRFILHKYRLALSTTGKFYTLTLLAEDGTEAQVLIPAAELAGVLKTIKDQGTEVRRKFEGAQRAKLAKATGTGTA